MVEQIPVKNKVRGSNPLGGAEYLRFRGKFTRPLAGVHAGELIHFDIAVRLNNKGVVNPLGFNNSS